MIWNRSLQTKGKATGLAETERRRAFHCALFENVAVKFLQNKKQPQLEGCGIQSLHWQVNGMILATPLEYILSAALFLSFLIIFVFALTSFYRLASGKTFETTEEESETVVPTERTVLQPKAAFRLRTSPTNMMVAALVAAIDYAEETKKMSGCFR